MPTYSIRLSEYDGRHSRRKTITGVAGSSLGFDANGEIAAITPKEKSTDYSASGALTISDGLHKLTKAGVGVMTLANPTAAQEGTTMVIASTTANAHTVTLTGGFAGAGSGVDVATFGGAIGDNMQIIAVNLLWHVLSLHNVTLG